ncbi:MAG TPA: ABC transporter permease [Verrucomicrobiae bacterium]|nr:ABC transporter permease [Verrucomicrobiae bacterium]
MRDLATNKSAPESSADQRGVSWIEDAWRDFIIGARMLRKTPGFSIVAILTLALGIGANTAIFSLVNALLLRPLPFQDPQRLVWISNIFEGGLSGETSTVGNFREWRAQNKSFEDLSGYFAFFDYGGFNITGSGEPERIRGVGVSQNFIDVLGVNLLLGRNFTADECLTVEPRAALLTHGFWQRKFAGDPKIIGGKISLNGKPVTVAGILPPSFDFTSIFAPATRVEFLLPFPLTDETDRWGNTLSIIGRLKPGFTIEQARGEFVSLVRQTAEAHPERRANGFGAKLTPLQEQISGKFRRSFYVLFAAVACVLLIACANLSNLLLARNASRRKEIAVRIAIGARRSRLIRQMLAESLLLSGAGALLGLPLAFALLKILTSAQAFSIPLLATARVETGALLFTLLIAAATGLVFGLAPAIFGTRGDIHESLKESARGSSDGRHRASFREILVVSEISLACVLLVAAGLFLRSFSRLLEVDLGFRPENLMAWRVEANRTFANRTEQGVYYDNLVASIRAIPGVQAAGASDCLPLGRNRTWGIGGEGVTYPTNQFPVGFPRIIDATYLQTMKIPLVAGRYFDHRDTPDTERSIIVNQTLAKALFPGESPLERRTRDGWRVVGIVGNVRHSSLESDAGGEMYFLGKQIGYEAMELVVRSSLPPESLIPAVRAVLRKTDPELPTGQFQSVSEIVDKAASPKRLMTQLLGAFSILALALATIGIYGVLSYTVSQRQQEMGIRLAIGSPSSRIVQMILSEGMRLALLGVLIGLLVSLAVGRVLGALLYEVSPTDPATFAVNAALLTAVALVACWIPALRASRIDPMIALRSE